MENILQMAKRILKIQCYRYKQKGLLNISIGLLILYLFLYEFPNFVKNYWPEKFENKVLFQGGVAAFIVGSEVFFLSILYLPGYMGLEFYKKYDVNPDLSMPWERKDWPQVKKKTIIRLALTYFVINPIYFFTGAYFGTMRFQGFPTHAQIIKTVLIVYYLDDMLHTLIHRLFHVYPSLYKYHKVHHEYDSVYTIMAQYTHPIEQIFAHLIPASIIIGAMKVHVFTFIIWVIWKLYNSTEGHCRYNFGWSPLRLLPFNVDASYHEFHHSKNDGNYSGTVYLYDFLFGWNKSYWEYKFGENFKKMDEALESGKYQ